MPFSVAHDAMAMTGEAPLWDPDRNCLWWIDIQNQLLLCHTPGGDPVNRRIALPGLPGLTALAESGRIVVGFENGLWTWDPERETLEQFSDVESDRPNVRLNDGKPDAQGRLWFGSMDATLTRAPIGRLYRRDPDGHMVTIRDGITISNAIAIPPSGDRLYFADSPTRNLECHDLDPASGNLNNARIHTGNDNWPDVYINSK